MFLELIINQFLTLMKCMRSDNFCRPFLRQIHNLVSDPFFSAILVSTFPRSAHFPGQHIQIFTVYMIFMNNCNTYIGRYETQVAGWNFTGWNFAVWEFRRLGISQFARNFAG